MEKERKTSSDSMKQNNLPEIPEENILNHAKAEYLYLVSQVSSSFDKNSDNIKTQPNIQYKNDKAALIAADLALQYLQKRNLTFTLDTASLESNNLLIRHFEDRWLAREVQVRGKQDVLHGLILSKKNNKFDIGFGSNFMKKKKEEEDKKYRSNTFRSKSLPAGNNIQNFLNESDENNENEISNKNFDKQTNESENRSRSSKSKSSRPSKTKPPRKSYQGPTVNQNITDDDEIDHHSSQISNNNNNENDTDSQKIKQNQAKVDQLPKEREIENVDIDSHEESISNHQSQSQKTSNGSGSNNINDNTINSNILPSPLKTTYSGRENEDEDENENESEAENVVKSFCYIDDEMKTHTYQYSTIYSDDGATHITEYEYETIEQLADSNDYNSNTYEYSNEKISQQQQKQKSNKSESSKKNNHEISESPNINNYTGTYEYSYTTTNEYSSNKQNQNINLKNTIPPKKRQQKEDLQLEFPFVQSRDAFISSDENNNKQQNYKPQQKKHHDYYYHKHSKKDKLVFSSPVEFDNPADFVEIKEEGNLQIEAIEKISSNQNNSFIIEEEEEVGSEEENKKEEEIGFFIFHAVDIEPDLELQKLFKSRAKANKGKNTSSVIDLIESHHESSSKRSPQNKIKSSKKQPSITERNAKLENSKSNPSFSGLFDYINSASENQKEKKNRTNKRNGNKNISPPNNKNKNKTHNRNQVYKHGSIKRGSQFIESINSKISGISNIKNDEYSTDLYSGVSSLVIIPSSSSTSSILNSSNYQKKQICSKNNNQISNEKYKKTKFSNKLKSSKVEGTKSLIKNSSASFDTNQLDIEISDSSITPLSIDKICEAISEDELLEMSDAPSVSFD